MKFWKYWYLIAICFVLGENLWDYTTAIQILWHLNTLQNTSVFGRCTLEIKYTSFINDIRGITLRITWINAIDSTSVVLKFFLIVTYCTIILDTPCTLLHIPYGVFCKKNETKTDIFLGWYRLHIFFFWTLLRIFVPRLEIPFCSNHYFLVCILKYCKSLHINSGLEI